MQSAYQYKRNPPVDDIRAAETGWEQAVCVVTISRSPFQLRRSRCLICEERGSGSRRAPVQLGGLRRERGDAGQQRAPVSRRSAAGRTASQRRSRTLGDGWLEYVFPLLSKPPLIFLYHFGKTLSFLPIDAAINSACRQVNPPLLSSAETWGKKTGQNYYFPPLLNLLLPWGWDANVTHTRREKKNKKRQGLFCPGVATREKKCFGRSMISSHRSLTCHCLLLKHHESSRQLSSIRI